MNKCVTIAALTMIATISSTGNAQQRPAFDEATFANFVPNIDQVSRIGVGRLNQCMQQAANTMAMVRCNGDEISRLEPLAANLIRSLPNSAEAATAQEAWSTRARQGCLDKVQQSTGQGSIGGVEATVCYRRELLRRIAWIMAGVQDAPNLSGLKAEELHGNWVVRDPSGVEEYECYGDLGNLSLRSNGRFGMENRGGSWRLDGRTIQSRIDRVLNTNTGKVETTPDADYGDWATVALFDDNLMLVWEKTEYGEVRTAFSRCPAAR